MNVKEYLITCLAEECSEVIQRCTKILRFGLDEVQEGQELTNVERLAYEYNDLLAVMEEIKWLINIPNIGDVEQIEQKRDKIQNYLGYSKSIGMVEN